MILLTTSWSIIIINIIMIISHCRGKETGGYFTEKAYLLYFIQAEIEHILSVVMYLEKVPNVYS